MANEIINTKVTESEWNRVKISGASTRPNAKSAYGNGLSASDTKEMFDAPSKLLVDKHNALVDILDGVERIREGNEAERAEAEEQRRINEYGAAGYRYDSDRRCVVDEDGVEVNNDQAGRVGAELEREAAEKNRMAKDAERDGKIAKIETLVGDIDTALDSILAIQESLIGGGA